MPERVPSYVAGRVVATRACGFGRAISEIVDELAQIRLQMTGLNTRALMIGFEDDGRGYELALNEISDGQKALIALYALIHLSSSLEKSLFLVEPENYVALSEIQPWLMALDERCGESIPQALICSHHPEMTNFFGAACPLALIQLEREGLYNALSGPSLQARSAARDASASLEYPNQTTSLPGGRSCLRRGWPPMAATRFIARRSSPAP
ncbi:MAG: hypothetical protein OXI01_14020 [Albidovulum sp.]|nr:hypothetical protein [Albidovulum sp.]